MDTLTEQLEHLEHEAQRLQADNPADNGAASRNEQRRDIVAPEEKRLQNLKIRHYERQEAAVSDEARFFGANAGDTITRSVKVNLADLLMTQRAIKALLPGWSIARETCYDPRASVKTRRLAVEVAPDEYEFVLEWGRQFWSGPDEERMIIDVYADHDHKAKDCELTFILPEERHEWLRKLLPELRKWGDANHFFKYQSITVDGEFVRLEKAGAVEQVILPPDLRSALQRNCIDMLAYADLYRANNIPLRRGIVLHGPPGTGKTSIGRMLARQCKATFILCTPGMLEEADDVRRAFKWARRFAPSILFFEDVDMVAGNRHQGGRNGVLGEFLSGLDGLDSTGGVITIATTNDLRSIESALKDRPNRFDCILEIGPLPKEQRVEYLQCWAQRSTANEAAPVHQFDTERIAGLAQKFTGAQMQELCRLAVFEAVELRVREENRAVEMIPLTDEHFDAAFKRMGKNSRRPVGFITQDDE